MGATSCYVTDNADLILYRDGLRYLEGQLEAAMQNLCDFADRYAALPCLGYTHYQPAQLVTVGKRATLWLQDLMLDLEELRDVLSAIRFSAAAARQAPKQASCRCLKATARRLTR